MASYSTGQAKRPERKEGETLKSFKERLNAWALKYDTGRQASMSLAKILGGNKRKNGQKATLNGKPVVWKDGEWRSASRTWKNAYGVGGTKPAAKKPTSKPQTPKTPKPQTTAAPQKTPVSKAMKEYNEAKRMNQEHSTKASRKAQADLGMKAWAEHHKGKKGGVGDKARAYLDKLKKKKNKNLGVPLKINSNRVA